MRFNADLLPKPCADKFNSDVQEVELNNDYIEIYHHWDGYPSSLGKTLLDEFNDYDKALNLCLGGDASTINNDVIKQYTPWRGESWEYCKPSMLDAPRYWNDYLYKFEDGEWYVMGGYSNEFVKLADYINEHPDN